MTSHSRRLVILGATGTVGVQALKLLQTASGIDVVALSAHSRDQELAALAAPHGCATYLTASTDRQQALLNWLHAGEYDICLNAVVGAAGLPYSAAVLDAGKDLALANKESMVLAGELLTELSQQKGGLILPVDSEHSAIHQCLRGAKGNQIRDLYLTASGGALRDLPQAEFASVTPEQALAHPNWNMGKRITIDSATMMNKALEIIEACHLFHVPADQVKVLIHRQSIVHSMVEFVDGSMLAQLGPPDMTYPIHYALHYPDRPASQLPGFDPKLFAQLTFEQPDLERFPALTLGWRAAEMGGIAGAVINAADEIAVDAFLNGDIGFADIYQLCNAALEQKPDLSADSLTQILRADQWAREHTRKMIQNLAAPGVAKS
jgi:1-deoxy-D-xylulose-5-phosphate reductoisomerase